MKNQIENKPREAHTSIKKVLVIVMFIFFSVFFIGVTSAVMEWDNFLDYENNDLTVIITNWMGLGERIGTATLKSHSTVDEILHFGFGKEEVVMYYDFNFSEIYIDGLGEVTFTNVTNGEIINKDYYFVKWVIKDVVIDDYEYGVIGFTTNGSEIFGKKIVGDHLEAKGYWERLINNDIPNRNVRIGIKTYVEDRDYIDAIWTIAGKKVSRHSVWDSGLDVDLILYYNYESTTELVSGEFNLIIQEGAGADFTTVNALIGKSGNYTLDNNFNISANDGTNLSIGDSSVNWWIKYDTHNTVQYMWIYKSPIDCAVTRLNNNLYVDSEISGANLSVDVWHMITLIHNGSDMSEYLDGSLERVESYPCGNGAGIVNLGTNQGGGQDLANAMMDEMGWWNRTLSQAEITQLYNGGAGITKPVPPVINVFSPTNTTFSTSTIFFNATADQTITEFIVNYNGTNITSFTINTTLEVEDGNHQLLLYANGTDTPTLWSLNDTIFFSVDTAPVINVFSPTNTTFTTSTIFFNATSDLTIDTFIINYNGTNVTLSNINTTLEVEDGTDFNLLFYGNNSNSGVFGLNDSIFFTVDTTPPQITVTFPNETLSFQEININLSVNWTVSDTRLDTCILEYDGVNTTVTCLDNSTNINITSITNKSLVFYVNDTLGNSNSSSVSWNYKIFQNSLNYTLSTIGGNTETFTLNITKLSSLQISTVDLVYNESASSASFTSGDTSIVTNTLIIPNPSANSNFSFFFSFTLDDNSIVNTSSNNQTVLNFAIGNCSTFSTLIYNFTMFDEENLTKLINVTIDYAFNLFDDSRTTKIINFSASSTANPTQICINQNLTASSSYSLDAILQYVSSDATDYLTRFYNILNFSLKNSTIPNNISIYDVISDTATPFQLTFRDSDLVPARDILVNVNKQFVFTNDFRTVEIPITDTNGQTILNLVINTGIYNLIFVDIGGNIIASFTKVTAFCDVAIEECTLSLNAPSTIEKTFNLSASIGISYTLSYTNSTSTVTLTFSSLNSTALTARIIGTTQNQFGNRSVCDSSLTSTLGTLDCDASSILLTDNYLFIDIFSNGNYVATRIININPSNPLVGGLYGTNGYFIAFLILLFIIILFSDDKQVLLVMLGMGWAVVLVFGLVRGTIIGSISGGIWLIVSIATMLWKLNVEERGK